MDWPAEVMRLLRGGGLRPENLGRSGAQVYQCGELFLKVDREGALRRAAVMQEYFARKRLSGALVGYVQAGGRDYLICEGARGLCGCDRALLDQPEYLADRVGEAVRALHETDAADCPLADANERAIALKTPPPGALASLRRDALVHGDCCLPNLFLSPGGCQFIDLGGAGLGDRHFDLYWATWSLGYNLGSDAYTGRLLDAYGRDVIDPERLVLCARLSREEASD